MLVALLATLVALAASDARAETFLIQSGQDSSPYSFTPASRRGFLNTAYAFSIVDGTGDHTFEYYIRFNLPPELLQPGVQIDHAYAWVYHGYSFTAFGDFSDEIGELLCHEVLGPWSESQLTWNNRPPIGPWFDRRVDILDEGLYWCDVTELVEGWLADPSTNYGIALTSGLSRVMGFYSFQDGTVGPNLKPSLLVETVPEPAATTSLVAGGLLLVALERRRARRHPRRNAVLSRRRSS